MAAGCASLQDAAACNSHKRIWCLMADDLMITLQIAGIWKANAGIRIR
jgi:hypothetical protein